ncbi:MAG: FAD-binding oxidoreductase [Candidatus Saccharibacteria bacterium]|nr:FAD-binding oxidoreductase [Candidatus Saccharibacteria bacterium]
MTKYIKEIEKQITGEVSTEAEIKNAYSHDASLFEVVPQAVVFPKDSSDVQSVVNIIRKAKQSGENAAITARSAGTDMGGAAIGESIVLDMTKYFNAIHEVTSTSAHAQPGVYYRDFEVSTLEHGALLPPYPASRGLCTIGGMVANNSGGEKSLQYGKTENFVRELKVVLSDGNEYTIKPLKKPELDKIMKKNTFEGRFYKQVFDLVENNYDEIKAAKPNVSKDSTGYHIWNVWDRDTGIFDLTQLIVGSQGTLGIVTDITFRLVPAPRHSGTLVVFLRDISDLGKLINDVLRHKPATFEGFDNYTLMLSIKLFFYFRKTLGWFGMMKLGLQLIPNALMMFRGIPKMVLLIEFNGQTKDEVKQKVHNMRTALKPYNHEALFEEDETEAKAKKFWIMRRESFNLLRKKVKDKHTAPFIDDLVVPPHHLPAFLPKVREIMKRYKLLATIAGHMGDGNFHIIPLMEIEKQSERDKLEPAMREVNKLVLEFGGSLSGEHNDGMIRGPWLEQMYGAKTLGYFKQVKSIFDPTNIFNPHKKTDAEWEYSINHVRKSF